MTSLRRRATRTARPSTPPPLALVAVLLGVLVVMTGVLAAPAGAVDVVGDDGKDVYVGTGGLVMPSRTWLGDESGRQEAASSCDGCSWRITSYCPQLEFDTGGCAGAHVGCPAGLIRVRVWLQRPGEPWRWVGAACIGGEPPVTREQVGSAVRDRAEAALPPLLAGVQPRGAVLVGLPAVFRTGQPADGLRGADLTVLDLPVTLDATPRWRWVWGDGSSSWTSVPGGRWPVATVRHTYRRAGVADPSVEAVWDAQYVVDGLGPFPVPGPPLTQQDAVALTVREARALLVR